MRQSRKYSLILLASAAFVIVLGIVLKPKEKPVNVISEIENARLQRLTTLRRLNELGDYISYAAQKGARSLVWLPELQQTGITIATGVSVVTAMRSLGGREPIALPVRPDLPVMVVKQPSGSTSVPPALTTFTTGDWVLAVALREDATPVFAYGLFQNAAPVRCGSASYQQLRASIPFTASFIGGGLFSLSGDLGAVIVRCNNQIMALSADTVLGSLKMPVSANDVLQQRFGLRVAPQAGPPSKLQVISTWDDSPAARAELQPGDVVESVDDHDVESAEQFLSNLTSDGPHTIAVRRGRRKTSIQFPAPAGPQQTGPTAAGITFAEVNGAVTVRSVAEDAAAKHAGVLPGDIVRRIGADMPASAAAAAEAIAKSRVPVRVTFERGGRQYTTVVAP